ncbi:DUF2530 domain-containing protein [Cryptosporangium phraense]|uniref:DUF2530 domain-containing protein n=1 Tax=Cryptosporangium phraense TaxID=2593070 RepID=A0A545API7_9ACTN|nr:DUF2530 domain-containing protein [Cryptosporangium phraense]TQS43232.1 DUF2530 domain-containing protein [Cryptosporangium phraense]
MARRPSRPTPQPLDVDAVSVVTIGTVLWGVGSLVLATVARGWLERHDDTWWIWTCVAGFLLGLVGTWFVRHRRSRLARAAEAHPETPAGPAAPAAAASPSKEEPAGT